MQIFRFLQPTRRKQMEWKNKTLAYAASVNAYAARGKQLGWDKAGPEPVDPGRENLAPIAIRELRRANLEGSVAQFREDWPPAHAPFLPQLDNNGQAISCLTFLDEESLLVRVGSSHESGNNYLIKTDTVQQSEVETFFGVCPRGRFFAHAEPRGVVIRDGWQGKVSAVCSWPNCYEGLEDLGSEPPAQPLTPTQLVPFPDGDRVLLVSEEGIFVLSADKSVRLLPTAQELAERRAEGDLNTIDDLGYLSMEHGAISANGKHLAVGCQDSNHLIYNSDLEIIADIYPESSYPVAAAFSRDGSQLLLNSCHFYNGVSIVVPLDQVDTFPCSASEAHTSCTVLESDARVYAALERNGEWLLGDAHGHISGNVTDRPPLWSHFVGSSVGAIALSPSGAKMAVSTYAGFVSILALDSDEQNDWQIGDSRHRELRRWIFWKQEEQPLVW